MLDCQLYCFLLRISFPPTFISIGVDRQLSGGKVTIQDSIVIGVATCDNLTFNNIFVLFKNSFIIYCMFVSV